MKRKLFVIALAAVLVFSVVACSAAAPQNASREYVSTTMETAAYAEEAYYEDAYDTVAMSGMKSAGNGVVQNEKIEQEVGRKLIRDASVTLETKAFDELLPKLEQQVASFGGYIESMNENGNSYSSRNYRTANFTVRVPADQLDAFLNVVEGIGNITRKTMSTRDVTSQYVDVESRLKVLNTEKESLERIMASAETTIDMLETQSRLYDVIEEIESYEATKRTYDALISYSTVSIYVQEVIELTPAKEETRGEELARRFRTSLEDLSEAVVDFGIGFVVALPWLLVFGVVFGGIFLAIFLPIRAHAKKKKAKAQETK